MGTSKSADQTAHWPIESANSDSKPAVETKDPLPPGRIVHDERGNAKWGGADGDSTSTMLRRLELPGLKVEGQEEAPPTPAQKATAKAAPTPEMNGAGYNPYDQHKAVKKPTTPKGPVGRRKS